MNQRKKGVVAAKKQVANKTLAAVQEGVKASKGGSKGHWEWKKVWVSSFLQLSSDSSSSGQATAMRKVLQGLEDKAKSLKSGALYGLVVKLRDSPFDSVKRMIEGLIDKIDESRRRRKMRSATARIASLRPRRRDRRWRRICRMKKLGSSRIALSATRRRRKSRNSPLRSRSSTRDLPMLRRSGPQRRRRMRPQSRTRRRGNSRWTRRLAY